MRQMIFAGNNYRNNRETNSMNKKTNTDSKSVIIIRSKENHTKGTKRNKNTMNKKTNNSISDRESERI